MVYVRSNGDVLDICCRFFIFFINYILPLHCNRKSIGTFALTFCNKKYFFFLEAGCHMMT